MALAPIAGLAVADRLGFVPLSQLAACVAVVALLLTQRLPEPARSRATIPFTLGALVSVEALVPSAVLFLVMLGYGALVTFLPIHARQQDVNPGLFFLVFALVVTAVRNYAGHLSDRFGRVTVAAAGLGLAAAALAALAVASDASSLMAAGVIYGAGFGALTTALLRGPCTGMVEGTPNSHRPHASLRRPAGKAGPRWRSLTVSLTHAFQTSSPPGGTTRTSRQPSRPVGPKSAGSGCSPRAIGKRTPSTIHSCVRRISRRRT